MKVEENKKTSILESLLITEKSHSKDLPKTNVSVQKNEETIDKLELSTGRGVADRSKEKDTVLSSTLKEFKHHNFMDKVELSIKRKPHDIAKEKEKSASITISQDRINALLAAIQSETYNSRLELADKSMMKSRLFDILV